MTDGRKNIKMKEPTYDELSELKPDGVTWDWFFRELAELWREDKE